MDILFGDADTVVGTPSLRDETGSLLRPGSPGEVDYRGRPHFGSSSAIPGLPIDPPDLDEDDDGKTLTGREELQDQGIGGWISRMVGRARGNDRPNGRDARYSALQQGDE